MFSFGHLTFQEHLAGEYLAYSSSAKQVAARFGDDWWREPLNFYASIRGDITDFAEQLLAQLDFGLEGKQFSEMLKYAPYTSPGIVEAFGGFNLGSPDEEV